MMFQLPQTHFLLTLFEQNKNKTDLAVLKKKEKKSSSQKLNCRRSLFWILQQQK